MSSSSSGIASPASSGTLRGREALQNSPCGDGTSGRDERQPSQGSGNPTSCSRNSSLPEAHTPTNPPNCWVYFDICLCLSYCLELTFFFFKSCPLHWSFTFNPNTQLKTFSLQNQKIWTLTRFSTFMWALLIPAGQLTVNQAQLMPTHRGQILTMVSTLSLFCV